MALIDAEVAVCNEALDIIGATTFTTATQTSDNNGIKAARNYETTLDSTLRSFEWSFAKKRVVLGPHTESPDFEWDYKFKLPDDYLRFQQDYTIDDADFVNERHENEGKFILSDNDSLEIKYIRKVTDPDEWDALFKEVFLLRLALKLLNPLAGTKNTQLRADLKDSLKEAWSLARVVARQESNVSGRSDWAQARKTGGTMQIDDPV